MKCCGSEMFIPDPGSDFFPSRIPPNCFHPGSRIRIKEFEYFNPKKWFLSSMKYDPSCSSRIPERILTFYPSRIPGSKRHRIRNTGILNIFYLILSVHGSLDSPLCLRRPVRQQLITEDDVISRSCHPHDVTIKLRLRQQLVTKDKALSVSP